HLTSAIDVLILGMAGAVILDGLSSGNAAVNYMLVAPAILAAVLVPSRSFWLIAIGVNACAFTIGLEQIHASAYSHESLFPVAVTLMASFAAWLATRPLHSTLEVVWDGYIHALRSERFGQERQAELRRVLKQLDEAIYVQDRLNYRLRIARDQADEGRRLKQQFAQTISHELRTPLNLIVGFTELMTQSPEHYGSELPFSYLRDLNTVYQNAVHLKSLVDDVLDMARIEAAQMTVNPKETDLEPFVRDAVDTIRGYVAAKGLSLDVIIEPGVPKLWIDQTRIRQVLFNLLNNAVRFTDRGRIIVSVHDQGTEVIFAVADTGVGIAPEDAHRIFEVFQQLETYQRGGTGLGLAISKRFVELHGGRIWVESEIAKGSTFFFGLPVERIDPVDSIPETQVSEAAGTQTRHHTERTLMAVTQSQAGASLLSRYLGDCRTMIVQDLERANQTLQKVRPEAVVIDTATKKFDSKQLQDLARAWTIQDMPVIACPLPGGESMRHQPAVDGYLTKPISRDHLWTVLRQFGEQIDKILIVDDNRDFARLLTRMLDHPLRRYRVWSAYNGQEGLELLSLQQPDLIFLDLAMPVMDGLQFLERFRAMTQYQHIPLIVVTGQDETDEDEVLDGVFSMARGNGLRANEIVRLVQAVLDGERISA
ncbi:MAG TPA: ATP-binding protein, partial [Aggregatilineaceae bacterium]|nr:ATP-binding protein [Aggregatilineaceae bacterium]